VPIGVLRQVLKASLAAATAASTSAVVANGTRASTSCVAGLTTSRHSVVRDSTNSPSIKSFTVGTAADWVVAFMSWLLEGIEAAARRPHGRCRGSRGSVKRF